MISNKRLVSLFFETGTLRKIARSHRQTLLTDDFSDNIASHSFRVSVIGYFLALKEKADSNKVVLMCLFHDFDESRSNDLNWVHKKYVKVFEKEIFNDQFSFLHKEVALMKIISEYNVRKSQEALIAKDADLLDQILLLREYEWKGNKEASKWLKGDKIKRLSTQTAKSIAKEIIK